MSVLIIQKDINGKVTGRCDARCYNSKIPICECICGGMNHGVGYHIALQHSSDMFTQGQLPQDAEVADRVRQQILFPTDSDQDGESTP